MLFHKDLIYKTMQIRNGFEWTRYDKVIFSQYLFILKCLQASEIQVTQWLDFVRLKLQSQYYFPYMQLILLFFYKFMLSF